MWIKNCIGNWRSGVILWIFILFIHTSIVNALTLGTTDKYTLELDALESHSASSKVQLTITPQNGWTIFAKNKTDSEINPEIKLSEDSRNVKSISSIWPESYVEKQDSYVYQNSIILPIEIHKKNPTSETIFHFTIRMVLCNKVCINESSDYSISLAPTISKESSSHSLIYILAIAFLGGFILNLMPCVLPVISLKVLSLVKAKEASSKITKFHLIAISLGILTSFIAIGISMGILKSAGKYAGLGFNFQQPGFITTLALILTFFASSIRGHINIDIPQTMKHALASHSTESKIAGSFVSGAFATILATPCTAPLIGTAISFALAYGFKEIILIFGCMGLGMALPFIIFATFPKMLNLIPKPGPWFETFKKMLEIIIYLTVIWLIWIISNQLSKIAAITLFLLCVLLKFSAEVRIKKIHARTNLLLKLILISAVSYCAFIIPPSISSSSGRNEQFIESHWEKFELAKLDKYISQDKIILVDVTADWCITCKYNKAFVLDAAHTIAFSKKHNLILMRADYTNHSKEIEDFLRSYKRHGIPFNVVFSKKHPEGIVLPTMLSFKDITEAVKDSLN